MEKQAFTAHKLNMKNEQRHFAKAFIEQWIEWNRNSSEFVIFLMTVLGSLLGRRGLVPDPRPDKETGMFKKSNDYNFPMES